MTDWKTFVGAAAAVAGTVVGAVWLAGHRDATIDDHEKRIARLETSSTDQGKAIGELNVMVARLNEQLKFLNENIKTLAGVIKH